MSGRHPSPVPDAKAADIPDVEQPLIEAVHGQSSTSNNRSIAGAGASTTADDYNATMRSAGFGDTARYDQVSFMVPMPYGTEEDPHDWIQEQVYSDRPPPPPGCASAAIRWLYKRLVTLPLQILMVLITVMDVTFLIYEYASDSLKYESVTLFTATAFMVELIIQMSYEREEFFRWDTAWHWGEAIIVPASFLCEYTAFILHHTHGSGHAAIDTFKYLRAIRILRVFIIWKTRVRLIIGALRRTVSADRRRFIHDGFDLDLTYVCPELIAMSWPSESVEAIYRNHIDVVAHFLDKYHPDSFMVYNLCSERGYDESKFHNRVRRYRLDDHNPGEIKLMLECAQDVTNYLSKNPTKNKAVIHCKGGKGRTGTMVCAWMLFSGKQTTADGALELFGTLRTAADASKFQGVESPSQDRYVRYFAMLVNQMKLTIPRRRVRIASMHIDHLPEMWWNVGKLWFVIIQKPNTERKVVYVSNPRVTFNPFPKKVLDQLAKNGDGLSPPSSPTFASPSAGSPARKTHIQGCHGHTANMTMTTKDHGTQPAQDFVNQYFDESTSPKKLRRKHKHAAPRLTIDTTDMPELEDDVVVKFFYNVDNPDPLRCAMQLWFHPAFESTGLHLTRAKLDGPQKDWKQKKFASKFSVQFTFEDVPVADSIPEPGNSE